MLSLDFQKQVKQPWNQNLSLFPFLLVPLFIGKWLIKPFQLKDDKGDFCVVNKIEIK